LKNNPAVSYHQGDDEIEAWLNDTSEGKINLLFLDEINMKPPGYYDFLRRAPVEAAGCVLHQRRYSDS